MRILLVMWVLLIPFFSTGQTTIVEADTIEAGYKMPTEAESDLKIIADEIPKLRSWNPSKQVYSDVADNLSECYSLYSNPFIEFLKGYCYEKQQSYDTAITYYSDCIRNLRGKNVFVMDSMYMKYGNTYTMYKTDTINYYHVYDAYLNRASCKFELDDYRGAISDYNTALLLFKSNREFNDFYTSLCYGNIAVSKYNLSLYQDAQTYCNLAISIDAIDGFAYYIRGLVNYKLGLKENACNDLSKAGELGEMEAYNKIKEICN
jgi:tetratricopeptide (TPR) repeat protein